MTIKFLEDGTQVIYLKKDWTPATEEDCEMIKLIKPDGEVVFGFPVPEEENSAPSSKPPTIAV